MMPYHRTTINIDGMLCTVVNDKPQPYYGNIIPIDHITCQVQCVSDLQSCNRW